MLSIAGLILVVKSSIPLPMSLIKEVILPLPKALIISLIIFTALACRFPTAPSIVAVEPAAFLATSVIPNCMNASFNSSAEISPFAIASRKSPSV